MKRIPGQAERVDPVPTFDLQLVDLRAMTQPSAADAAAKAEARARERAKREAVLKVAGIALDDLVDRGIACNGCGSALKAGRCPFCSPDSGWGRRS